MSEEKSPHDLQGTEATRTGAYAQAKGEVVMREHVYDGIREYDQKLPNWWLFTLYAAIIFFLLWWGWLYTFGQSKGQYHKIDQQVAALDDRKSSALEKTLSTLTDQVLIEQWATDPAIVSAGEQTYMQICHTCHGTDLSATMNGAPLPGRALNDGEWVYGREPMAIFKMINEGTPADSQGLNGMRMVAKGGLDLTAKQVAEITAYLIEKNPKDFAGAQFGPEGQLLPQ